MIKMIETMGDRMLARFVPHVTAQAEPCECSGVWSRTINCYCACGNAIAGAWYRQTQSCSGCRLSYSSCSYDFWSFCWC
jgi:hypothetical protein